MFERSSINVGGAEFEVKRSDGEIQVNGKTLPLPIIALTNRLVTVKLPDRVERFVINRNGDDLWMSHCGRVLPLTIETERDRLLKAAAQAAAGEGGRAMIRAAMPGMVVRVIVTIGQTVKRGDPVVILEAMKMENEVRAPADGVVHAIMVTERDSVEKGAQLVALVQ